MFIIPIYLFSEIFPGANTVEIDWLFALPIALCGLKLDDEAVRVAVGLRLGLDLCIPHQCHCGSPVDAHGLHSFVWQRPENNFTHTKAALKVVFFSMKIALQMAGSMYSIQQLYRRSRIALLTSLAL